MIAYTSQMCHVISNAYVKSPRAQMHKGYSAGSYMDLTRVAWLNEHMWTDLFLENRDYLLEELDRLIGYLGSTGTPWSRATGTACAPCWRRAGSVKRRWMRNEKKS